MGSTPCQVGPGRVGVWVESGTGRGRIGVNSVSSRVGSARGPGRVGDGAGSCWGQPQYDPDPSHKGCIELAMASRKKAQSEIEELDCEPRRPIASLQTAGLAIVRADVGRRQFHRLADISLGGVADGFRI